MNSIIKAIYRFQGHMQSLTPSYKSDATRNYNNVIFISICTITVKIIYLLTFFVQATRIYFGDLLTGHDLKVRGVFDIGK